MNLRPYRKTFPSTTLRRIDPLGFGSSLIDDLLRATDSREIVQPQRAFPINVQESEKGYVLEAHLAGVKKENVDISVEDGNLTIAVTTPVEEQESENNFSIQEWSVTTGSRVLALPKDANPEAVKATMMDGVLRLEIAKLEEKQPKRVEIH